MSIPPPNALPQNQGLKRKAEDGMPGGSPTTPHPPFGPSNNANPMAMGPPAFPRTMSSSSGMSMGANMGGDPMMNGLGMPPQRPGSSVGMNSMSGMSMGPQGMGLQQSQQQGLQGQRQGSMPPTRQGSVPLPGGPGSGGVPHTPHAPMMGATGVKAGSVPPEMPPTAGPQPTSSAPIVPPSAPSSAPLQSTTHTPSLAYNLPPLPANVSLNPAVTKVSVVPLATSLESIPALSEKEIEDIKGWMEKDKEYGATLQGMKERMAREVRTTLGGGVYQPREITKLDKDGKEVKEKLEPTYVGGGLGGGWLGWWEKGGNLFDLSGLAKAAADGQVQGYGNMNRWRRTREPFEVKYPKPRREGVAHLNGQRGRKGRREGLRL
jgi:SWI/SNF-related matrix-associated actin-dependent regulator of chromatin subfamily B member 1